MNLKNISGIITEIGGVNSHMAIIARTNEIPAIVGIKHIFENIKESDYIALNGKTGEIFLNPKQEKIEELTKNQESLKQEKLELEKYKNEILQLLYRDERVADVVIDDEFNVDMVFYTDYCPFYYDDEKNIIYNQIMDSPTYQGIELAEFVGYMGKRVIEDSYISTRNLINNYVQTKSLKDTDKEILANFLKKSIIETGFSEKYIDNINVFVTYKNFQELEKGLMEIVKQKDNEALKKFEEEEFE